MPAAVSTGTVRARALKLAGLPDTFGDVTAQNVEVLASARVMYDTLIIGGGRPFRGPTTLSFAAGVQEAFVPADFYYAETAHLYVSSGATADVSELEAWSPTYAAEVLTLPQERGRPRWFEVDLGVSGGQPTELVRLWPTPDAAYRVLLQYVKSPVFPASGADSLIYCGAGWEDYLAYDLAIKLVNAEETDTSGWRLERDRAEARIMTMAKRRHAGPPARVPLRGPQTGARRVERWPTFRTP